MSLKLTKLITTLVLLTTSSISLAQYKIKCDPIRASGHDITISVNEVVKEDSRAYRYIRASVTKILKRIDRSYVYFRNDWDLHGNIFTPEDIGHQFTGDCAVIRKADFKEDSLMSYEEVLEALEQNMISHRETSRLPFVSVTVKPFMTDAGAQETEYRIAPVENGLIFVDSIVPKSYYQIY